MPITTSPFVLNNVSLTLKTTAGSPQEYQCQLNRAELVPSAGGGGTGLQFETFCDTHSGGASSAGTTWSLELTGFQAWSDATDLSWFLFTNDGAVLDYVLTPKGGTISATNPAFGGQVTAVPTPIGGTANQFAQFTASLPCTSRPTPDITP